MNQNIKKINGIGKAGRIIAGILAVCMIIVGVFALAGTVVAAVLPKDSLEITVNADADVKTKGEFLTAIKDAIVKGNEEGTGNVGFDVNDGKTDVVVAQSDLFKEAHITDTGDGLNVKLDSQNMSFNLGRLTYAMCVTVVNIICIIITLFMIKHLMKSLEICQTPFNTDVIGNMKKFAYSLIPFVVLRTVSDSAWESLFSKNFDFSIGVDFTVVLGILIVFMLIMIFSYGAELQKQSDETL